MTSTQELFNFFLKHPNVSTDTRNILPGCIFFALKGENFNANAFAEEALKKGAKYCVVDEEKYANLAGALLVENVLEALQKLAKMYRDHLKIPVIGLTGSNGKTTSKELINAVLSQKFKTFATRGNLNNHIGVPLSILSILPEHQIAVIEMGANHQKEIEFLCDICKPTHGLITNIGMAHLEGFGGIEGVKKGKGELYTYLKNTNGYTFINRDSDVLMKMSDTAQLEKCYYYGSGQGNTVQGKLIDADPFLTVSWTNHSETGKATTHLTGSYNFENILAAVCIGDFFDLSTTEIEDGLAGYNPNNNRSQITITAHNKIICDFYNANPSSMEVALKNLYSLEAIDKTAILGDMFELGEESSIQHRRIASLASNYGFTKLIFIGAKFFELKDDFNALFFKNAAETRAFIKEHELKESLVLLKGSRSMKLEDLLEAL